MKPSAQIAAARRLGWARAASSNGWSAGEIAQREQQQRRGARALLGALAGAGPGGAEAEAGARGDRRVEDLGLGRSESGDQGRCVDCRVALIGDRADCEGARRRVGAGEQARERIAERLAASEQQLGGGGELRGVLELRAEQGREVGAVAAGERAREGRALGRQVVPGVEHRGDAGGSRARQERSGGGADPVRRAACEHRDQQAGGDLGAVDDQAVDVGEQAPLGAAGDGVERVFGGQEAMLPHAPQELGLVQVLLDDIPARLGRTVRHGPQLICTEPPLIRLVPFARVST
jgi:hypothetical protein